jgi:hypothetical protein
MDDSMNVASVSRKAITLALSDIILDPGLQPRHRIDEATWEDYLYALIEGAVFPPGTVFREDAQHWLADGFHRWHAHKAAGLTEIATIVVRGTRLDALRFALGANAIHGKRREPGDYGSAYERAWKNGLVDKSDAAAVQALLRCTTQWAYRLTEAVRAEADAKRDADIAARKAAGQSNRGIARDTGLPSRTVDRAVASASKVNSLEMAHPDEPEPKPQSAVARKVKTLESGHPAEPKPLHPAQIEFDDMTSPRGQRWSALYDAVRTVNQLPSADDLFGDRYHRLDAAISPVLVEATARITEIYRRFFNV